MSCLDFTKIIVCTLLAGPLPQFCRLMLAFGSKPLCIKFSLALALDKGVLQSISAWFVDVFGVGTLCAWFAFRMTCS